MESYGSDGIFFFGVVFSLFLPYGSSAFSSIGPSIDGWDCPTPYAEPQGPPRVWMLPFVRAYGLDALLSIKAMDGRFDPPDPSAEAPQVVWVFGLVVMMPSSPPSLSPLRVPFSMGVPGKCYMPTDRYGTVPTSDPHPEPGM